MKVKIYNSLVEMKGDELAQVISDYIKEKIILRFFDIDIIDFDLSINKRLETNDNVTIEAAHALKNYKFGLKVSNITPTIDQAKSLNLKSVFKTSSGAIRNFIGGTIFREPIISINLNNLVRKWKKPIIVARHAFADQYDAKEMKIESEGILKLVFESKKEGEAIKSEDVKTFKSSGVAMAMYNTDESIEDFARSCFMTSLEKDMPLILTAKNTILKVYDEQFFKIFNEIYEEEFKSKFENKNLNFNYMLIDSMMSYILKSEGGFVWACKNYDGDVQSDFVAQGYGSMGLMSSMLRNEKDGIFLSETTHGTITKYYYSFLKNNRIAVSPVASVFMWTRIIKMISIKESNKDAFSFAQKIEKVCVEMLNRGIITDDLKPMAKKVEESLSLFKFLDYLAEKVA